MASTIDQSNDPTSTPTPTPSATLETSLAKRRRSGRRVNNGDLSVEERKRQRVLKNRESAMRSLAKKAAYSAKLETMAKEELDLYTKSRVNLQQLLTKALVMRAALDKVPDTLTELTAGVEACINRGTSALESDEINPNHLGEIDNQTHNHTIDNTNDHVGTNQKNNQQNSSINQTAELNQDSTTS